MAENQSKFKCVKITVDDPFGSVSVKQNNPLICADVDTKSPFGDISLKEAAFNTLTLADSYSALDTLAWNINRILEDTVIATESLSLEFGRGLEDTATVTDNILTQTDYIRLFEDTAYAREQLSLDIEKDLFETVLVTEDISTLEVTKLLEDSATSTDALSFSYEKTFEDFANPVDLIAVPDGSTYTFVKTLRNTVAGISDTFAIDYFEREVDFQRTFADTIAVTDDLQPFTLEAASGDIQVTTDADAKHIEKVINTTLRGDLDYMLELGDLMLGSASYDLLNSYGQGYYDLETYSPTDDISAIIDEMTIGFRKFFADSVIPIDAFEEQQDFDSARTDSATSVDLLAFELARTFIDATSGFTETTDIVPTLNKSDSVVLSEDIQQFTIAKELSDEAFAIDLVSIPDGSTYTLNKTVSGDVYSATDIIDLLLIWNRNYFDTATTSDEIQSIDVDKALYETAVAREYFAADFDKILTDSYTSYDEIALDVSRPVADSVSNIDDEIIDFNKSLADTRTAIDLVESKQITKLAQDSADALDESAFDLTKAPIEETSFATESSTIDVVKAAVDAFAASDTLEYYEFIKSLSESAVSSEQIQSFTVEKLLEDYANPVDLISVPDGATYEFDKTLRNTVSNITDSLELLLIWNRYFDDTASSADAIQTFDVTKLLEDTASASEDLAIDSIKILSDAAVSAEAIALDFARPLADSISNIEDSILLFDKAVFETVPATDEVQSFDVEKPIDEVAVATEEKAYSLVKPLSDAVSNIIDTFRIVGKVLSDEAFQYERVYLAPEKNLTETLNPNDAITAVAISKLLSDTVTPIDLIGVTDGITYAYGDIESDFVATPTDTIEILVATSRIFNEYALTSDVDTLDINKVLADIAIIQENVALSLDRTIDETVTSTEQALLDTNKALFETVASSESITDFSLNKAIADAVTVSEDITVFSADKLVQESAAVAEAIAVDYNKPVSEIAVSTDTSTLDTTKVFSEFATTSEEIVDFTFGKNAADTTVSTDFIQSFEIDKTLEDFANPVDLLSVPDGSTYEFDKTLRNTVANITDVINLLVSAGRTFTETLTSSDDITSIDFGKLFTETMLATDDNTIDVAKVLSDSATIGDSIALGWYKDYTETAQASDSDVKAVSKSLADSLVCSLALILIDGDLENNSDYFDMQSMTCGPYDLMKDIDATGVLDEAFLSFSKTFADSVVVFDTFDAEYDGIQSNNELASSTDAYAAAYSKPFAETITQSDAYVNSFVKNVSDSVVAFDTLIENRLSYRTVETTDSVTAEDSLALDGSTYSINKAFAEAMSTSDSFSYIIEMFRTLADSTTTVDAIQTIDVTKSLSDNPVILEAIALDYATARADAYSASDFNALDFTKIVADETNNGDLVAITLDAIQSVDVDLVKTDSVTSSENVVFGVGAQLNDAATSLEDASLAIAKVLSDTVSVDDLFEFIPTSAYGDTQAAADFIQSFAFDKTLQDSVSAIDLIGVTDGITYDFGDTEADTFGATDEFSKTFTANRSFSETVRAFDAIQGFLWDNPYDDALVMSDNQVFDISKGVEDSSAILEAYASSLAKPTSDTYTASDTIRLSAVYNMTFADPLYSDLSYELNEGDLANDYPSDPGRVYDLNNYDCHAYDLATSPQEISALCDAISLEPGKGLSDASVTSDDIALTAGYNREFADTVSVVDTIYFSYVNLNLVDTYAGAIDEIIFEAGVSLEDIYSGFTDSVSFTQAVSRLITDTAVPQDLLNVPDGSVYGLSKPNTDFVASTSDNATLTTEYNRTFEDFVTGLTDVIVPSLTAVEGYTESAVTTETSVFSSTKLLSDAAASLEAIALDFATSASDSYTATDVFAPTFGKAASDTSSASDTIQSFDANKVLADIQSVSEDTTFDVTKILSDTASTEDAATLAFAKTFTDSISLVDSLEFNRENIYGDTPITADAIQSFASTKLLSDSVAAVDLIGVNDGITYDFGDTEADFIATPSDVFYKQINYDRSFADSVLILDNIQGFVWDNPYDDALVMSDNDTLAIGKGIADSSTVLESYAASMEKVTSESLTASDVLTYSRVVVMSLADPLYSDLSYELNEGDFANDNPYDGTFDLNNYDCHTYDLAEPGPFEISAICDYISVVPTKGLSDQLETTDDITLSVEFLREFADTYDTQNVQDTIYFSYVGKALADAYSTDDAVSLSPNVALADVYSGITDSVTLQTSTYREINDSVVGEDTLALDGSTYSIHKVKSDSAAATDLASVQVEYLRTFSDLVTGITDIIDPTLQAVEGLGDAFGAVDVQSFGTDKVLSDTVSETDAIALSYGTSASDAVGTSDSSVYSTGKALFETPTTSDSIESFDATKVLADTQTTIDSIEALDVNKALSDYFQHEDFTYLALTKSFADEVSNITDSLVAESTPGIGDTQAAADAIQSFSSTKLLSDIATPADLIGVNDGITYDFNDSESDFVASTSDVFYKQINYDRSFADSVLILDSIQGFTWDNPYDDALVMSDDNTLAVQKGIADSNTILEAYAASMDKPTSDEINASDVLTYSRVVVMSLADPLYSSLSYELNEGDFANEYPSNETYDLNNYDCHTYDLATSPMEISALCDFVSIEPGKGLSDQPTTTDDITLSAGFIREFADTASTTDTIYFSYVGRVLADVYSGLQDSVALDLTISLADVYSGIEDSISLETASYREVNESVVGEDALSLDGSTYTINKVTYETAVSSDNVSLTTNYVRSFSDLVTGITDILIPSLQAVEGLGDTFATLETTSFDSAKLLTDVATSSEAIAMDYAKPAADTFTTSDELVAVPGKGLSETASGSDILQPFEVEKLLADDAAVAEQLVYGVAKVLADSYTATDAAETFLGKSIIDSVSNIDDDILAIGKSLADTSTVSEAIQSFDVSKVFADTATAIDLIGVTDGITYEFADTETDLVATPTDVLTRQVEFARTFADTVTITESIIDLYVDRDSSAADASTVSEFASLSAAISLATEYNTVSEDSTLDFTKLAEEFVTQTDDSSFDAIKPLADSLNGIEDKVLIATKVLSDTQSATDSIELYAEFLRTFNDAVNSAESISLDSTKALAEIQGTIDAITDVVFGKNANEFVTASEDTSFDIEKLLSDSATPVDLISVPDGSTYAFDKSLGNENVSAADTFDYTVAYERTFSDAVSNIVDVITQLNVDVVKAVADTSTASDAYAATFDKPTSETQTIDEAASLDVVKGYLDTFGVTEATTLGINLLFEDPLLSNLSYEINEGDLINNNPSTDTYDFTTYDNNVYDLMDYPVEVTALSDEISIEQGKGFGDTLTTPIDDITLSLLWYRDFADTQGATDVASLDVTTVLADVYSGAIDSIQSFDIGTSLADSYSDATDAIQSFDLVKSLADSVSVIDMAGVTDGITYEFDDTESDSIGATDATSLSVSYNRSFADVVSNITDSITSITREINDTAIDAASTTDLTSFDSTKALADIYNGTIDEQILEIGKSASDALYSISDDETLDVNKVLADSISNIEDNIFFVDKVLVDTQSTSDDLSYDAIKVLADTQSVSEDIALSPTKSATDYILITPSADKLVSEFTKSLLDTQSASDSIQSFDVEKTLADTANAIDLVGVSDGITYGFGDTEADTFGATDQIALTSGYIRDFAETFGAGDADPVFASAKLLSDSSTLIDSQALNVEKLLSDTVTAIDELNTVQSQGTIDSAGATDVLSFGYALVFHDPLLSNLSYELNEGDLINNNPSTDTYDLNAYDGNVYDLMDSPIEVTALSDEIVIEQTKGASDTFGAIDSITLSNVFTREFADVYGSADAITLELARTLEEIYSGATDEITSFDITTLVAETITSADSIASFDVDMVFADSASAIDLVSVPDGSTYELIKTQSDSVNTITDNAELVFEANRTFGDIYSGASDNIESFAATLVKSDSAVSVDDETLDVNKVLADSISNIEDNIFFVDKVLTDSALTSENRIASVDKVLADTATSIDSHANEVSKPFSDTASAADVISLSADMQRQLADIYSGAIDTASLDFGASFADSYSGATDLIETLEFNKGIVDVASGADAVELFNITKALADFANPVDMIGVPDGSTYTFEKTLANTVSAITDNFDKVVAYVREYNESISAVDAFAATLGQTPYTEAASSSDVYQAVASYIRDFDETMATSDDSVWAFTKAASESLTTSDDITDFSVSKGVAELATILEATTFDSVKSLDDAAIMSDASELVMSTDRAESITLGDSYVGSVDKAIADSGIINEEIQTFGISKSLSDTALSEDLVGVPDGSTYTINKTSNEVAVSTSDNFDAVFAANREFSETYTGIVEELSFAAGVSLNDTSVSADDSTNDFGKYKDDFSWVTEFSDIAFAKSLNDSAVASENLSLVSGYIRAYNETSYAADSVQNKSVDKEVGDTYTADDSTSINKSKAIGDANDIATPLSAGSLIMQDYVDITYFADDYIGETRTFT